MSSRVSSGVLMSTAMTMSAPISRTTLIGRLLAMPPSTRVRPSMSTAAKAPGTAMLARTAWARSPCLSTTSRPVAISVATAR